MDLNERKKLILQAIIEEYIREAEPVGSKYISENYGFGLSSATIRNEMAELEELGFLLHPHTSAGRIPSQSGFRLYVDNLHETYRLSLLEMQKMQELMKTRMEELETFLSKASRVMSAMTNYTAITTTPTVAAAEMLRFDILPVSGNSFLITMVMRGGIVRTKMCYTSAPISETVLRQLSGLLNDKMCNRPLHSVNLKEINDIYRQLGDYGALLSPVLNYINECAEDMTPINIIVEGADNIFDYPEFSSRGKARELFGLLQDKEEVKKLVMPALSEEGIKIQIGSENQNFKMSDSSIVLGNYKIGNKVVGAIGIIGPVRMDYGKAISHIEYLTKAISDIFGGDSE